MSARARASFDFPAPRAPSASAIVVGALWSAVHYFAAARTLREDLAAGRDAT